MQREHQPWVHISEVNQFLESVRHSHRESVSNYLVCCCSVWFMQNQTFLCIWSLCSLCSCAGAGLRVVALLTGLVWDGFSGTGCSVVYASIPVHRLKIRKEVIMGTTLSRILCSQIYWNHYRNNQVFCGKVHCRKMFLCTQLPDENRFWLTRPNRFNVAFTGVSTLLDLSICTTKDKDTDFVNIGFLTTCVSVLQIEKVLCYTNLPHSVRPERIWAYISGQTENAQD